MNWEREYPKCVNLCVCSDGSLARFLDIREQDAPTTNFLKWLKSNFSHHRGAEGTERRSYRGIHLREFLSTLTGALLTLTSLTPILQSA